MFWVHLLCSLVYSHSGISVILLQSVLVVQDILGFVVFLGPRQSDYVNVSNQDCVTMRTNINMASTCNMVDNDGDGNSNTIDPGRHSLWY